jgi:hypothetical protein
MKIIGEGDDKQTIFEVGDDVRVKDQGHLYCGFYGQITATQGEDLRIELLNEQGEMRAWVKATQSQVEAN